MNQPKGKAADQPARNQVATAADNYCPELRADQLRPEADGLYLSALRHGGLRLLYRGQWSALFQV